MRANIRPLPLLVTAAWLSWVHVSVGGAQSYQTEQTRGGIDLHEYHTLMMAYQAGDDDAVRRLQEWSLDRLATVIAGVEIPGAGPFQWNTRRLVAAAVLHSEAALNPPPRPAAGFVAAHLRFASALLAKAAPGSNAFARRWYVAAARLHLDRLSVGDAGALLELGRRYLPGDALVLCESGRLAEYRARNLSELGPSSPRELFGKDDIETYQAMRSKRTVLLTRAAGWLREGVAAAPADAVCRLHLGRVLSLLGEDDEAEPILRALQQDDDDAVVYLASMFLGGAAERRGVVAEAEPFYRAAGSRFPLGQAAHVALSTVLLRSGRVAEARAALAGTVNGEQNDRRDPWWWYHLDPSAAVGARLAALLKEGRQ